MGNKFKENRVVFLEEHNGWADMLLTELQNKEINTLAIVLKDEPFLPPNFTSIYEYYLNKYETKNLVEKDLFYIFVDVPEFWEIQSNGLNGAIINNGIKEAAIYFRSPLEKRNVLKIEWNKENGAVYKVDYYNRYGVAYCSEFLDDNGVSISKLYYTSEYQDVINVNFSNGVVTLYDNGHIAYIFSSVEKFEQYVFNEIMGMNGLSIITSDKQEQWVTECDQISKTIKCMVGEKLDVNICI